MNFNLEFHPDAWDEWRKLDGSVRNQFKKKLLERVQKPCVAAARVSGGTEFYKIKLRAVGFRLVYQVRDETLTVLVLSVGKRDRNIAYNTALGRI